MYTPLLLAYIIIIIIINRPFNSVTGHISWGLVFCRDRSFVLLNISPGIGLSLGQGFHSSYRTYQLGFNYLQGQVFHVLLNTSVGLGLSAGAGFLSLPRCSGQH